MDAIYKINLDLIEKVHSIIMPNYGGGFKLTIELVCRDSDVELTDKEARFCFGMSKMTVKDEVKNHDEYDKLRFSEFLEFIGRVAQTKYFNEQTVSLTVKIERVLDSIFKTFGLKRRPVPVEDISDHSSDESVIPSRYASIDASIDS